MFGTPHLKEFEKEIENPKKLPNTSKSLNSFLKKYGSIKVDKD